MRPAGRFVADVLPELARYARPGTSLLELDRIAHELGRARGATSCSIDHHPHFGAMPFGKVLCTSVKDGRPPRAAARRGRPHPRVAERVLTAGIAAAVPGGRLGDIPAAVGAVITSG